MAQQRASVSPEAVPVALAVSGSEADIGRLVTMLCSTASTAGGPLEVTPANAHALLAAELAQRVVAFERGRTTIVPPVFT